MISAFTVPTYALDRLLAKIQNKPLPLTVTCIPDVMEEVNSFLQEKGFKTTINQYSITIQP